MMKPPNSIPPDGNHRKTVDDTHYMELKMTRRASSCLNVPENQLTREKSKPFLKSVPVLVRNNH
jgi:hypothetical protein